MARQARRTAPPVRDAKKTCVHRYILQWSGRCEGCLCQHHLARIFRITTHLDYVTLTTLEKTLLKGSYPTAENWPQAVEKPSLDAESVSRDAFERHEARMGWELAGVGRPPVPIPSVLLSRKPRASLRSALPLSAALRHSLFLTA
jgi:hypothetical protein